jgi:short-subunit dehydrogenase
VATRLLDTAASYDRSASQKMARLMMAHAARPERVAERIVRAIRRNEAEVSIGLDAWLTTTAHALSPSFVYGALGSALRLKARG